MPEKRPQISVKSVLHLGRTMRLVWSIAPGWTLASIALAVVQGVLPLASLYMIQFIVDAVDRGRDGGRQGGRLRATSPG